MKDYHIVFGAYVRMYADCTVQAENHEAARQLAVEEFKSRSDEMPWLDPNYDNLALPSIVSMQIDDPPGDVLEGYDFPITLSDARQYPAHKLLEALLNIMPDIESEIDQRKHSGNDEDWIDLDRKAADARAVIAEATRLDPQNAETPIMTPLKNAISRRSEEVYRDGSKFRLSSSRCTRPATSACASKNAAAKKPFRYARLTKPP